MAETYSNDQLPADQDVILKQVKAEIEKSREFVKSKREEFRLRLPLYNNQRKQREKVGNTLMYNIITTQLAIYYVDELTVAFAGRDVADVEKAPNIENLAKFDFEEMEMDQINYFVQWDRLFYGVGIRAMTGWDEDTSTPVPQYHDALSWLPDPKGAVLAKSFRWQGFEVEYTRDEMSDERGFFNQDLLKDRDATRASEKQADREAKAEASNYDMPADLNTGQGNDNDVFDMVDLFTAIKCDDGKVRKFLVTVNDDVTVLHRCEEVQAITETEKKNPSKVEIPVALNYWSPQPGNPFGVNVGDLCEDKQRAMSVFQNLRKKAEQAKLYPMYLYNKQKILNRRELDFQFNRFIGVNGDVGDNVVAPMNKAADYAMDTINAEDRLEIQAQKSTGTNEIVQGQRPDTQAPLGVEQMIQANASLKFILGTRFNAWGDKRFWRLWYRLYQQNFTAGMKKMIRIQGAYGSHYLTIQVKDIKTIKNPDIIIKSKLELQQERQRELVQWQVTLPFIMNDPAAPAASKRYAQRKLARLQNVPPDEIAIIFPESPDETRAHMENELLSRNESVPIDVEQEDHLSHLIINSQADDTPERNAHLAKHRQAYRLSGQQAQNQALERDRLMGAGQGQVKTAQNQISNQNSQMMSKAPGQGASTMTNK